MRATDALLKKIGCSMRVLSWKYISMDNIAPYHLPTIANFFNPMGPRIQ
jgi:hypothetical protein